MWKNKLISVEEYNKKILVYRHWCTEGGLATHNELGNLLTDSNNILNRWKNCQLLYVHGVSDGRHNEINTAEIHACALISWSRNCYWKSPGTDQISAEKIQAQTKTLVKLHTYYYYLK